MDVSHMILESSQEHCHMLLHLAARAKRNSMAVFRIVTCPTGNRPLSISAAAWLRATMRRPSPCKTSRLHDLAGVHNQILRWVCCGTSGHLAIQRTSHAVLQHVCMAVKRNVNSNALLTAPPR
jgi:hypothetical protein